METGKQTPPETNQVHRCFMFLSIGERRYKVDYRIAERRHSMGIEGGRIVELCVWREGEQKMLMYYDHEWITEAQDAETRHVLREIMKRAR